MAKLLKYVPSAFVQMKNESFNAFLDRSGKALKELEAYADLLPVGMVKGGILKFSVADGYAYYRVAEEKPLLLEHLPYCDGYRVDPALIRGLRLSDVRVQLAQARAWRKIFSDHAKKKAAVIKDQEERMAQFQK